MQCNCGPLIIIFFITENLSNWVLLKKYSGGDIIPNVSVQLA